MTVRTDNFARANGSLGANWTDWSWSGSAGCLIASDAATGNGTVSDVGDFWSADSFGATQFSLVTVGTVPSSSQWVGVTVRQSGAGSNGYLAIWFNGTYYLFRQIASDSPPLITSAAGSLNAGDSIALTASGSTLTVYRNGTQVLQASDSTSATGAPGIAFYGQTSAVSLWMGGDGTTPPLAGYISTDGNGAQTWETVSALNLPGPNPVRVLPPSAPSGPYPHSFLITLPVEIGQGSTFGDPLATIEAGGWHNQYNLTVMEPGYPIAPWYADNPSASGTSQESFLLALVTWLQQNFAVSGTEQVYLIGFSKSGLGGNGLLFRHPAVFQAGAFWDYPAGMTDYDGTDPDYPSSPVGGGSTLVYGTSANFTSNYELDSANLTTWKNASTFGTVNRLWLGGWNTFQGDVTAYHTTLTTAGILHTYALISAGSHNWAPTPGWVGPALAALFPEPGTALPASLVPPGMASPMAFQRQRWPAPAPLLAPGADTGTGTDSGSATTTVSSSDTGTGTDSGSVTATVPSSDTGSGADSAAVTAAISGADTGSGADSGAVTATIVGADTGAGADTGSAPSATVTGADTGTGADSATAGVTVSGADTGAGADTAAVSQPTVLPPASLLGGSAVNANNYGGSAS